MLLPSLELLQKLSSAAALQCQKSSGVDISQDGQEVNSVAHTI